MELNKILRALILVSLGWLTIVSCGAPIYAQTAATPPERELFTQGQKHYAQGKYNDAINVFRQLLTDFPHTPIRDLGLLWLGRSYLKAGRIAEAEVVGDALRAIPDTPFADIYATELRLAREAEHSGAPLNTSPPPVTVAQPSPAPPAPASVTPNENSAAPEVSTAGEASANSAETAPPVAPTETVVNSSAPVETTATTALAAAVTESVKPAPVKIRLELKQAEYVVRPGETVNLPVRVFNDGGRAAEFVFEALNPGSVIAAFGLTPEALKNAPSGKLKTPAIAPERYADIWLTLRFANAADARPRQAQFPLVVSVADEPANTATVNVTLIINPKAKGSLWH